VRPAPGRPATLLLAAAEAVGPSSSTEEPGLWRDRAMAEAARVAWAEGDLAAVGELAAGYDALLLLAPARADDGTLHLRPVGNAERRHRGAFSTPPAYANALAARALGPVGGGPAVPTVVDPACGAGALLRAVLARLLARGIPAEAARTALHGVDADPVATLLCRAALAADLTRAGFDCRPEDLADRIVTGDALLGPTPTRPAAGPGVVWHELFPAVLARPDAPPEPVTGWRGGFDAVVANPPWERLKVHARDWAGAPPPGLRGNRAGTARGLRDAGRHPLTGTGELNAYLPFVETCWRLLAPAGRAALLVPAGIASDRSAARLLEALAGAGRLARLHLIDPVTPIFAGVSGRVGVAVIELAGGASSTAPPESGPPAEVAVGLASPDEPPGERAWPLTADLLRTLNPNTGTAPLFGSAVDARIVTAVHRRVPVLLRRDPASGRVVDDEWQLRLITPFHMTRDAPRFHPRPGEGLVPLWEAKHCGLLDPFGGGTAAPRYWVSRELVQERYGALCDRGWLAGFRNVSTTAGPRTLLPAPLPVVAVGNSLPLISATRLPLLLAALASIPVDYLLRQKHAGANVNFFKLEQVPVPSPAAYDRPSPWGEGSIGDWVLARFARAVVWAPELSGLVAELGPAVPVPPDDDPARRASDRASARADLDAVHAVLLGLTRAELVHLLGTFTALRAREEKAHGRFVTAEQVLAAYDRLQVG
jgi:N-6 DNA Methylase